MPMIKQFHFLFSFSTYKLLLLTVRKFFAIFEMALSSWIEIISNGYRISWIMKRSRFAIARHINIMEKRMIYFCKDESRVTRSKFVAHSRASSFSATQFSIVRAVNRLEGIKNLENYAPHLLWSALKVMRLISGWLICAIALIANARQRVSYIMRGACEARSLEIG